MKITTTEALLILDNLAANPANDAAEIDKVRTLIKNIAKGGRPMIETANLRTLQTRRYRAKKLLKTT